MKKGGKYWHCVMSKHCEYHGENSSHITDECRAFAKLSLKKKGEKDEKQTSPSEAPKPEETNLAARNRKPRQARSKKSNRTPKPKESEKSAEPTESTPTEDSTIAKPQNKKNNNNKNKKNNNKNKNRNKSKKPNTTDFQPSFDPPDLRIRFYQPSLVGEVLRAPLSVHDVCYVPGLFCEENNLDLYQRVLKEVTSASNRKHELFVQWHGDSHVIANDRVGGNWKSKCPTLLAILKQMETFFDFQTNATRVNWYRPGSDDWKPYHHDRAAFTAGEPQNFTIAASLGCTREVGFEHAKRQNRLFLPVANGSAYTFCRDVNIEWKHGVVPTNEKAEVGRISIIAWGLRRQDASQSRVTTNDVPSAADLGI